MHKLKQLSLITLMLGVQSSPILSHAQTVTESVAYHPFYLEGVYYDSTTGVLTTDSDFDATDKILIKNESIQLSTLSYHSIHFWDNNGDYLGHYVTPGAKECVNACIGEITTSDIPLPLGAYSYAVERFDRDDADYDIATNVSLIELFGATTYNLVGDSDFDYIIVGGRDLVTTLSTNTTLFSNIITNGDFSNGAVGWNLAGQTYIDTINQNVVVLSSTGAYSAISRNNVYNTTDKFYFQMNIISISGSITISDTFPAGTYTTSGIKSIIGVPINSLLSIKRTTTSPVTAVIDDLMAVNLTTLFGSGNEPATTTDFQNWVTNYTTQNYASYYTSVTTSQLDYPTWVNYYSLWSNNVVSSIEVIDQQYYLNGDRKEIYDLTTIFGSGSEPDLATMQGYYTDYDALFDYSTISSLSWAVAPTYTVTYWDDQVGATLDRAFSIIVSGVIGFILMFFGMARKSAILNIMALAAFIFFTIQFTALPMIILGVLLVVVNLLFVYTNLTGGQ